MSEYMNFYLKPPKGDIYCPLGDWHRITTVYQTFQDVVKYEEGTPISADMLAGACGEIRKAINRYNNEIADKQDMIDIVAKFDNVITEKEQMVIHYLDDIVRLNEKIREHEYALGYIHSLITIKDSVTWDDDFSSEDKENYLWAGIEWCPNCKED